MNELAKMLKINPHPDHLVTLKAVSTLVKARLNENAIQNPGEIVHQVNEIIFIFRISPIMTDCVTHLHFLTSLLFK